MESGDLQIFAVGIIISMITYIGITWATLLPQDRLWPRLTLPAWLRYLLTLPQLLLHRLHLYLISYSIRRQARKWHDRQLATSLSAGKRHKVFYRTENPYKRQVMSLLVRNILTPVVGDSITIIESTSRTPPPKQDGNFRVVLNDFEPQPAVMAPTAFRKATGAPLFAHTPSADGWTFFDSNTGFVFAELIGNDLIILCKFYRSGLEGSRRFIAWLLFEVAKQLRLATAAQKVDLDTMHSFAFADQCQRVCQLHQMTHPDDSLNRLRTQVQATLQQSLVQMSQLDRLVRDPAHETSAEFDRILQLHNVADLLIEGPWLIVTTKPLECVHPQTGVRYAVGVFKIAIHTRQFTVNWFNQTRTIGGMQAPHVNKNGVACLGNTTHMFPNLIAQKDYYSAIQLAIVFIESVNLHDSWGSKLINWPLA